MDFHLEAGDGQDDRVVGSFEAFIRLWLAPGKGGVLRSGSLLPALELPGSCFAREAANGLSLAGRGLWGVLRGPGVGELLTRVSFPQPVRSCMCLEVW